MADTDDEALSEAEEELRVRDELELDALAERERQDTRHRHDVNLADAEVAELLRLANRDDLTRDRYRGEARREAQLSRQDTVREMRLRAGVAGRDDPEAEADRDKADRYRASAMIEADRQNRDDATADAHSADARERRIEAAQVHEPELPPAAEAVRNPPQQPPRARKNLLRRRPKTKELKDYGLGD